MGAGWKIKRLDGEKEGEKEEGKIGRKGGKKEGKEERRGGGRGVGGKGGKEGVLGERKGSCWVIGGFVTRSVVPYLWRILALKMHAWLEFRPSLGTLSQGEGC